MICPSHPARDRLAESIIKELNFILLDSGLPVSSTSYCFDQAQNHPSAKEAFFNLRIDSIDHEMHVFESNTDITSILRHENIAKSASQLSSLKETRDNLIS